MMVDAPIAAAAAAIGAGSETHGEDTITVTESSTRRCFGRVRAAAERRWRLIPPGVRRIGRLESDAGGLAVSPRAPRPRGGGGAAMGDGGRSEIVLNRDEVGGENFPDPSADGRRGGAKVPGLCVTPASVGPPLIFRSQCLPRPLRQRAPDVLNRGSERVEEYGPPGCVTLRAGTRPS